VYNLLSSGIIHNLRYSNNGSTYITSLLFLALGLPDNHPFWKDFQQPWTSQKAWNGMPFPMDKPID
jgi:hypothetical protein